jgi:hypothetical protein
MKTKLTDWQVQETQHPDRQVKLNYWIRAIDPVLGYVRVCDVITKEAAQAICDAMNKAAKR